MNLPRARRCPAARVGSWRDEVLTFLMLEREPAPPRLGRQHSGVMVSDGLLISSEVGFYVELALALVETTVETVRVELWLTSIGGASESRPEH
jgi:hypothetical protein